MHRMWGHNMAMLDADPIVLLRLLQRQLWGLEALDGLGVWQKKSDDEMFKPTQSLVGEDSGSSATNPHWAHCPPKSMLPPRHRRNRAVLKGLWFATPVSMPYPLLPWFRRELPLRTLRTLLLPLRQVPPVFGRTQLPHRLGSVDCGPQGVPKKFNFRSPRIVQGDTVAGIVQLFGECGSSSKGIGLWPSRSTVLKWVSLRHRAGLRVKPFSSRTWLPLGLCAQNREVWARGTGTPTRRKTNSCKPVGGFGDCAEEVGMMCCVLFFSRPTILLPAHLSGPQRVGDSRSPSQGACCFFNWTQLHFRKNVDQEQKNNPIHRQNYAFSLHHTLRLNVKIIYLLLLL